MPIGADFRDPSALGYDPLTVTSFQASVDNLSGYKRMRKIVSGKTADLLESRLGKGYWTEEVAPIALDSLYATIVASASGRLSLKHPSSILDEAANRLAARGKMALTTASQKNFPTLPVVGNLAEDLAKSQNLNFDRGQARFRFKMKKRLAPEFKLGQFSFSGGTETTLNGKSFSKKSVASVAYKSLENSYRIQLCGRNVRFDVSWSPVDLCLDWNPRVVKFDLKLDIGSWF